MNKFLCTIGLHTSRLHWYDSDGRHLKCKYCGLDHPWDSDFPRPTRLYNVIKYLLVESPGLILRAWRGEKW